MLGERPRVALSRSPGVIVRAVHRPLAAGDQALDGGDVEALGVLAGLAAVVVPGVAAAHHVEGAAVGALGRDAAAQRNATLGGGRVPRGEAVGGELGVVGVGRRRLALALYQPSTSCRRGCHSHSTGT